MHRNSIDLFHHPIALMKNQPVGYPTKQRQEDTDTKDYYATTKKRQGLHLTINGDRN